jgi:death-on-curing protein
MEEFTVEEVIGFQIEIIRASGIEEDQGLEGRLLNPGNLDFVIAVGNRIPDPFERAAFMLHGIATGHPFVQGNKRIAFLLAALILKRRSSVFLCRSMSILKSSCTEGRGSSGRGILGGPAEHGAVESRGRLYEDPGSATFSPLPVL